ncbi:14548_t:CDS:1, partial [Funneliformis caledonium]
GSEQSMLILKGDDQNTSILEGNNQNMSISESDIQSILFLTNNEESVLDDILEDILEESEFESKINTDYPNEAYGDLMVLVINYKLSNKTGNAIIRFFNKYANLNTSSF